jgi:hypothetical protein
MSARRLPAVPGAKGEYPTPNPVAIIYFNLFSFIVLWLPFDRINYR